MRLLFQRPSLFAAGFPVSLLYNESWVTSQKIRRISHIPVWFVHDINDQTTPFAHAQNLYELLLAASAPVRMYATDGIFSDDFFDNDGNALQFDYHWAWVPALNNTVSDDFDGRRLTLFEWLAQKRRAEASFAHFVDDEDDWALALPSAPEPVDQGPPEVEPFGEWTMVPLRQIAEAFGALVDFDVEEQLLLVTLPQEGEPELWEVGDDFLLQSPESGKGEAGFVPGQVHAFVVGEELPDGGRMAMFGERLFAPAGFMAELFGVRLLDIQAVFVRNAVEGQVG